MSRDDLRKARNKEVREREGRRKLAQLEADVARWDASLNLTKPQSTDERRYEQLIDQWASPFAYRLFPKPEIPEGEKGARDNPIPIAELAKLPDFPFCAVGIYVRMGRLIGKILWIAEAGRNFYVNDDSDTIRKFCTSKVIELYP